ncbi:MAG: ssl1498 family light-harvesting-like protein [Thermosynechococcaceae cyanobacterium]
MISTTDERGVINNFARDPEAYAAEYPSSSQQRTYWVLGVVSAVFMSGVLAVAFAVS